MNRSYWIFGGKLEILADEQETGSTYDLISGTLGPGVEVPLHQHHSYTESIYMVEGELTIYLKGETKVLHAGDHIFIPRSTPHAIQNNGTHAAKAITVASPGSFARLIKTVGIPGKDDGTAPEGDTDLEAFMRISAEMGDELLGPPGTRP